MRPAEVRDIRGGSGWGGKKDEEKEKAEEKVEKEAPAEPEEKKPAWQRPADGSEPEVPLGARGEIRGLGARLKRTTEQLFHTFHPTF